LLVTTTVLLACNAGLVALSAPPAEADVVPYAVIGATQKVLGAESVSGATSMQLAAARNEFVSSQIVIPGGSTGRHGVSVSLGSSFTGPAALPDSAVTVYREGYYKIAQPSAPDRSAGQWPDALIPARDSLYGETRNAFPADISAGQNLIAFVDILVPTNQAPGSYSGSFTISSADGARSTVPAQLQVRPMTLPPTASSRSLFKLDWSTVCAGLYGGTACSNPDQAWRANYDAARLALDDRITIANMAYQPPADEQTPYFNKYELPLIRGTGPIDGVAGESPRLPGASLTTVMMDAAPSDAHRIAGWNAAAQSGGFASRMVTYLADPCDEPARNIPSHNWTDCRTAVNTVRNSGQWQGPLPNVMTASLADARANDPTLALTDILAPVVDQSQGLPAAPGNDGGWFLGHAGKQLWSYTSCDAEGCSPPFNAAAPGGPRYPDYTIDAPAARNRSMGWFQYEHGTTGQLYWDTTNQFTSAWDNQFAGSGNGGHGDGTLLYPGTPDRIGGTTPIPLESFRLKMIRDGEQDYEYLRLADQVDHARTMSIAQGLYTSTAGPDFSDAAVESARAQLAAVIDGRQPPSVTVTKPASGATLSGPTTLAATAAAPSGIANVTFQVDGQSVGAPVTTSPYQQTWNSASVSAGSHTVTATATASDGSTQVSAPVAFSVGAANPGHLVLSTPVKVSPAAPVTGSPTTVTFTMTNTGGTPVSASTVLAGARDPSNANVDFPATAPLTVQPGASYTYTGSRTFTTTGNYTTWPSWFDGTNWQNLAAPTTFTVSAGPA
jgi:hypothetical protein